MNLKKEDIIEDILDILTDISDYGYKTNVSYYKYDAFGDKLETTTIGEYGTKCLIEISPDEGSDHILIKDFLNLSERIYKHFSNEASIEINIMLYEIIKNSKITKYFDLLRKNENHSLNKTHNIYIDVNWYGYE